MVLCGSILVYQQTWQYTSSISPRNEKQKVHEFEIVIKIYCVQYLQECSKRSATFVLSLWSCESFVFNCYGAYRTDRAGFHLWSEGDKDGYVRQQRSYSSSLYPDVLALVWISYMVCDYHHSDLELFVESLLYNKKALDTADSFHSHPLTRAAEQKLW